MSETSGALLDSTVSIFPDEDIILKVRNLHTYFFTDIGIARALNGVNFDIPRGKVMGMVGESGCGKSVTALSILRMVVKPGKIVKGEITLYRQDRQNKSIIDEIDITKLEAMGSEMRSLRGAEMSMIFQEPMTSLNPSYTIGNQIMEGIILHQKVDKVEAEKRAIAILDGVGMANPALDHAADQPGDPFSSPAVYKRAPFRCQVLPQLGIDIKQCQRGRDFPGL